MGAASEKGLRMTSSRPARRGIAGLATCLGTGLAACLAATALAADLPLERQTITRLDPDASQRIYLADMALAHIVDGRLHVIDGRRMRYLSAMSTGFAGQIALARPARALRGQHLLPAPAPRRAQRRGRGLWHRRPGVAARDRDPAQARPGHEHPRQPATSADGRWLLVQNATPASSVTVVDLKNRRTAAELPTPGCWGVIPWPQDASRFSTVCGDGSLATLALDEAGQARRAAPRALLRRRRRPGLHALRTPGRRTVVRLVRRAAAPAAPQPEAQVLPASRC
jgi:methylamine dehydrogenase heavy chain